MNIRNRITAFRMVKASELRPNPRNWRKHPEAQQNALRGILAEVGYVDALLARTLPDGSLELVDGHLRAETTPDQEVPVLVVDLDEDEAAKVLATFDPLGDMAEMDSEKFADLYALIETESDALREMLDGLAEEAGVEERGVECENDAGDDPRPPASPMSKLTFPPRVWLTQRDAIQAALSPIIESFGGTAEWAE